MVTTTWWSRSDVSGTQEAKKEIAKLFPQEPNVFATPKPLGLLTRVLGIASAHDSLILDSFAGSGTTAHAVLAANAKDGGDRKFILNRVRRLR
jgi:adenine-specific DNA-methyltransferase